MTVGLLLSIMATGPADAQSRVNRSSMEKKLSDYVEPLIQLGVFSGSVLVSRGSMPVIEKSFGAASVEHGVPVTSRTVFRIASISKSFTKAVTGRLIDEGKLSLDDRLSRWLPGFPSAERITVRMLVEHRAGIPNINSLPFDEEALSPNTLSALVDSISKHPLDYEPGSKQRYSNGGYAVLARVTELSSGMKFADLLEVEVLKPLHLSNTAHESNDAIIPRLADGYMPSPEIPGKLVRAAFQEMDTKLGGGSMVSTSHDLLVWIRSIGRSSILRAETWAALFPEKDSVIAYSGRSPGFNAFVLHDRKHDITAVVLANNYSAGMVSDLAEAALAIAKGEVPSALPVRGPVKPDVLRMKQVAGFYMLPDGSLPIPPHSRLEIRLTEDNLVAYLGTVPVDVLVPQGGGHYLARALWSMVDVPAAGPVDSIVVRALYRNSLFTARRVQP
jgi:CubicO group peptidase (beta-lactamase class C family)